MSKRITEPDVGDVIKFVVDDSDGTREVMFYCPGCKVHHTMAIDKKNRSNAKWTWNGDRKKPTLSPSLLCNPDNPSTRCHLHVEDGVLKFLDDCYHELRGRKVPMEAY